MQVNKKIFLSWLPAILWMLVIFGLSSLPGQTVRAVGLGPEQYHIDGHFMLFLILTVLYFKAVKKIPLSILLTFLFAISDEFHQSFTPGRDVSAFDIMVDTIGATVAGIVLWKLLPKLPKKLKDWLMN